MSEQCWKKRFSSVIFLAEEKGIKIDDSERNPNRIVRFYREGEIIAWMYPFYERRRIQGWQGYVPYGNGSTVSTHRGTLYTAGMEVLDLLDAI